MQEFKFCLNEKEIFVQNCKTYVTKENLNVSQFSHLIFRHGNNRIS